MNTTKTEPKTPQTPNKVIYPSAMMANLSLSCKFNRMRSKTMQNKGDEFLHSNVMIDPYSSDEDAFPYRS